jgi:hypothetical protein
MMGDAAWAKALRNPRTHKRHRLKPVYGHLGCALANRSNQNMGVD